VWNGQITWHGVDEVNGSTSDGSYTFTPVQLKPGTPSTIFTGGLNSNGTPSGHGDLQVSAGSPFQTTVRFFPNPEFSPSPAEVVENGAVTVGALC
jgi:hypothetical protein